VNGAGTSVASKAPFWMSSAVTVGSNPHGIAITPDGTTAVVANAGNPGGVTFVNLTTFATQARSFAGQPSSQPGIVAITPDGATALVVQLNNVVLVGLASKSVAGVFSSPCVGTTLYGIAITPDGSAAVMPDFNAGCTSDVVDIITLPGATLANAYPLSTSATAFGAAVTPDGASALITRGVTATSMRRLDLSSGAVTTISNTSSTYGVAVTPDGMTALATSGSGDTVKLISLTTNAVTGSIAYASNSDVGNIAIAPGGQTAVVVGDFDVGILSIATSSVVTKLPGAGRSVAITPDGKRALFTGAGASGKLHVIKLP
jgi:DNA-binding beta-propeller fold protein YncE